MEATTSRETHTEGIPASVQKTAEHLQLSRLFVLYAVNSLTGTTLTVIKKLGIDKLLQKATPGLRAGLALLVRKPETDKRMCAAETAPRP